MAHEITRNINPAGVCRHTLEYMPLRGSYCTADFLGLRALLITGQGRQLGRKDPDTASLSLWSAADGLLEPEAEVRIDGSTMSLAVAKSMGSDPPRCNRSFWKYELNLTARQLRRIGKAREVRIGEAAVLGAEHLAALRDLAGRIEQLVRIDTVAVPNGTRILSLEILPLTGGPAISFSAQSSVPSFEPNGEGIPHFGLRVWFRGPGPADPSTEVRVNSERRVVKVFRAQETLQPDKPWRHDLPLPPPLWIQMAQAHHVSFEGITLGEEELEGLRELAAGMDPRWRNLIATRTDALPFEGTLQKGTAYWAVIQCREKQWQPIVELDPPTGRIDWLNLKDFSQLNNCSNRRRVLFEVMEEREVRRQSVYSCRILRLVGPSDFASILPSSERE